MIPEKERGCVKRISGTAICWALSVLLFLGFVIDTIWDYRSYNSTMNSAPFSLWINVNLIIFVVPAVIALIVGFVIKKKKQ